MKLYLKFWQVTVFLQTKTKAGMQKFKSYRNKLAHLLKKAKRHHYCCKFDLARNDLTQTVTILRSLINRTKMTSKFPETLLLCGCYKNY